MSNIDEIERKVLQDNVEGWRNRLWEMEHVELPKPSIKQIAIARRELERAKQNLAQFEHNHSLTPRS